MHLKRASVLAATWLLVTCTSAPISSVTVVQAVTTLTPAPSLLAEPTSAAIPVPTPSPNPTATPVSTPAPTPVSSYVVGAQDTVSSIAGYFGMSSQQLVGLNPGLEVNPDQLLVGDILALAAGGTSKLVQARSTPPPAPVIASYVPAGGTLWGIDDCEYGARGNVAFYLDVLRQYNARAIFFLIGPQACGSYSLTISQVQQAGYEIGNHTAHHANLTQVAQTALSIDAEILGGPPKSVAPKYFRPPYCASNALVAQEIARLGYTLIPCGVTSGDTTAGIATSCQAILSILIANVRPNSIVTMHMFNTQSPRALDAYLSGRSSC